MEQKRCYGCMNMRSVHGYVCEHCGYDERVGNLPTQLAPGTVLNNQYLVGKVLGQGEIGITYMGLDLSLNSPVAIKEFCPVNYMYRIYPGAAQLVLKDNTKGEWVFQLMEAFVGEAQILARLSGESEIVRVRNVLRANGTAYIIMEYAAGSNLREYVTARGGRLSEEETLRILKPIVQALQQVHGANVIHRDINPDNIIVMPNGRVKLIGFGAARYMNAAGFNNPGYAAQPAWRKGFIPLEQEVAGGQAGPWSDVYALCATIYYCLTGTVIPEAVARFQKNLHPDWSWFYNLTGQQKMTLAKGLAVQARDRVASMEELYQGLYQQPRTERISDPVVPVGPGPDTEIKPDPDPKPPVQPKRPPKGLIIGAAAAVVAVVAAVAVFSGNKCGISGHKWQEATCTTAAVCTVCGEQGEGPTGHVYLDYSGACSECGEAKQVNHPASCGAAHVVVVQPDGTVRAEGLNNEGQSNVSDWSEIVVVSAGYRHTVGVRKDGTVVSTQSKNEYTECNVSDWRNVVDVSTGKYHTVGLLADGTVVATGNEKYGRCEVDTWENIVQISCGDYHTLGLKADGTVVSAGWNDNKQREVQNWNNIIAVSGGHLFSVGLRKDGTVVATGDNDKDQHSDCANWTDIVMISAGFEHTVGLRRDGTVVVSGPNEFGECDVQGWSDVVYVCAGEGCTVGIQADGTVLFAGKNSHEQKNIMN